MLQFMKTPQLDRKDGCESVLWDTAYSVIFAGTEHSERIKFPCKEKRLHIRTLGGTRRKLRARYMIAESKI